MLLALLMGGLGLIVGSFLGLVSLRLPRGEDIVVSRSRCGGCGRPLKPSGFDRHHPVPPKPPHLRPCDVRAT